MQTYDLIKLKMNWESYLLNNVLSEDTRPFVKNAWDRCIKMKIDYNDGYGRIISDSELKKLLEINDNLISIAKPIMENIYETINKTSFSIILTDREGILIHIIENDNIISKHNNLNFIIGTRWDEKNVGSNAIGTALALNEPVQMVGAEHYCISHHLWTCSASPIHDSMGNIIGCLNISGSVEDQHIHTFGIVTASANIIKKQLDLIKSYKLMNTVFNSILNGLIVIDRNYNITHINEKMKCIFRIKGEEYKAINILEVFAGINIEEKVFIQKKSIRISDHTLTYGNLKIEGLINISPFNLNNKVNGAVILVKEAHQVRRVVSHIAGYSARYTFEDIITKDEKMKELIDFSKKISQTECTVLIQGESGTGKELFAHSIHSYSRRKKKPFIAINCAALPKELVESELFGYEKGAFTGASTVGKPGKFELANGGTIMLDEIGEMPIEVQSKLLRVLDNHKICRIGSNHERDLNVRIIAATNRNLRDEIKMNSFREDLYFRLNVINITLIPLRERKEDILIMSEVFLERLNNDNNIKKYFSDNFKRFLINNQWKGNVRELQNIIQREYYLSNDSMIEKSFNYQKNCENNVDVKSENLQDVERLYIIEALSMYNGDVLKAANRLNIGKSTIYRKLKKYNIDLSKMR